MIPSSRLVPTSLNKGRPVYVEEPDSEVSQSIRLLASRFTGVADQSKGGEAGEAPSPEKKRRRRLFGRR
jgi:MinD-like ATPase involved in chromosome partitioning or flagellar assembly